MMRWGGMPEMTLEYTLKENGRLADIIPTMIEMMGMEKPAEMTGESLLIKK